MNISFSLKKVSLKKLNKIVFFVYFIKVTDIKLYICAIIKNYNCAQKRRSSC